MAVVNNYGIKNNNEDELNQQGQAQQAPAAPVNVSGSAAPSNAGSSAAPTVSGSNAPTSSGRFTNIQKYLDANKNFNNGEGLAGKINTNLTGQIASTQQGFNQGDEAYKTQLAQNRITSNPNLVAQAVADPTKFQADPNNVAAFGKLTGGTYNPGQAFDYSNFSNQASNIDSLAKQAQTEKDRPALLKNMFGNSSYTGGQKTLDNVLLQADPNQLQKLGQLSGASAALNSNITNATRGYAGIIQNNQDEAAATRAATGSALGDAVTQFGTRADAAATAANLATGNKINQLTSALRQGGSITPEDLALMDLSPNQLKTYGIDPSKFITKPTTMATAQTILSPEQQASIKALGSLSNGTITGDAANTLNSFANGLGGYSAPKSYFDKAGFLGAVGTAGAGVQADLQNNFSKMFQVPGSDRLNIPGMTTSSTPAQALAALQADMNANIQTINNRSGDSNNSAAVKVDQQKIQQIQNLLDSYKGKEQSLSLGTGDKGRDGDAKKPKSVIKK